MCFMICHIPLGLAQNVATILIFRFLGGLFGSAPLAIVAGMYVDFLGPIERGISTAVFSVGVYCGPVLGPVVGNFATVYLGWRSTAWITMIAGGVFGLLAFLCTPETSEAVLLRKKAQSLRIETGNWALHGKSEEEPADFKYFVQKYLTKPVRMLIMEPIVSHPLISRSAQCADSVKLMIFTAYMSLVYGILYLSLTLYPFAFKHKREWTSVEASLAFLSLLAGIVIGCLIIGFHSYFHCKRALAGRKMVPEDRLPPVVLGSFVLPSGKSSHLEVGRCMLIEDRSLHLRLDFDSRHVASSTTTIRSIDRLRHCARLHVVSGIHR